MLFFFWVFCNSLPNQVEHTWLKLQLYICNYEWARVLFVYKGLNSKLQHCGPCKISWKISKTSHSNHNGHIEGDIMQNHAQKTKWKKWKPKILQAKQDSISTLPFSPWAVLATWLHVGSPSENTGEMSLIPVLNKNSPRAHTESELDVFGVHRKLVKYVVHLSKRKKTLKYIFSSHKLPKLQSNSFWPQGILGVDQNYLVANLYVYVYVSTKSYTLIPYHFVDHKILYWWKKILPLCLRGTTQFWRPRKPFYHIDMDYKTSYSCF